MFDGLLLSDHFTSHLLTAGITPLFASTRRLAEVNVLPLEIIQDLIVHWLTNASLGS